tara:strand:+ start:2623 stop:3336 length:714 start_codon:yes stop_codon:yes gene_type:complete
MKIAIVTGGSGNLGKFFSKELLKMNYKVFSLDIKKPKISKNINFIQYQVDITNENEVKNFFKDINNIDLLINNAGIGVYTSSLERTSEDFKNVMNVNLLGNFLMTQNALKIMIKKRKGKIINIGSIYGVKSSNFNIYGKSKRNNSEVYSATKAGVIMMTKYFAAHFSKKNIQINCISPGGIFANQDKKFVKKYENITPSGRMGSKKDLKSVLNFLIDKNNTYVNGQNISVDGGFLAW